VLSNTAAGLGQQFTDAELAAIVEVGHRMGRKVTAHAHGAEVVVDAAHSFAHVDFKVPDLGCDYLGTSHRQDTVKYMVSRLRNGLSEMFALPDGYEIMLGNGGSTVFWDIATFGLIDRRSQHLNFGEFSSKFGQAAAAAPFLDDPVIIKSEVGTHPLPIVDDAIDTYAFTHNETSTGVSMPLVRPAGSEGKAIVLVDATSAAGGLRFDASQTDVYYFAPQKCFASDGGLWLAACSPRALDRIRAINSAKRWVPASLDLKIALDNSVANQTYNTPALGTLVLLDEQIRWMLGNGGLDWCVGRSRANAEHVFGWAEASEHASPFVADPAKRSSVVGTIDFDESIDAAAIAAARPHRCR
jgi:phosphoserine aminotransferase